MGRAARVLSYQVKSRPVPGGEFRPFACASCHACGAHKELRMPSQSNNPEAVEKKFRAEGWAFSAWSAREITCPTCLEKRGERRRGESGRPADRAKEEGAEVVTLTLKSQPVDAAVRPPNKTELTVEERAKVRNILAGTFDEAVGQYSEGWSDQRVAEEAGGLPPKLVADLREIAFGPVRSVSEIEVLRTDLAALETNALAEIARIQAEVATFSAPFGMEIQKLRQRLDEANKRLGVKS